MWWWRGWGWCFLRICSRIDVSCWIFIGKAVLFSYFYVVSTYKITWNLWELLSAQSLLAVYELDSKVFKERDDILNGLRSVFAEVLSNNSMFLWIVFRKWIWNDKRPCFLKLSKHSKTMVSQDLSLTGYKGLCFGEWPWKMEVSDAYLQTMRFHSLTPILTCPVYLRCMS